MLFSFSIIIKMKKNENKQCKEKHFFFYFSFFFAFFIYSVIRCLTKTWANRGFGQLGHEPESAETQGILQSRVNRVFPISFWILLITSPDQNQKQIFKSNSRTPGSIPGINRTSKKNISKILLEISEVTATLKFQCKNSLFSI